MDEDMKNKFDNSLPKDDIVDIAQKALNDIIYTVIFDLSNEMIANGIDQDQVLTCATSLTSKYMSSGVKIRKKPAPRSRKTEGNPVKSTKSSKVKQELEWVKHPSNPNYLFLKSFTCEGAYPLLDMSSKKIIAMIDDTSVREITPQDKATLFLNGISLDQSKNL